MNNEKKEYTFFWFIENYSYCWHKNEEVLSSPEFTADGLEGSAFYLRLYPRGQKYQDKGSISLFLKRCETDDGPEDFPLKYELSVLAADGSTLHSLESEKTFEKGKGWGHGQFLQTDDVFLRRMSDYLPQDTLTLRCKIRSGEGNIQPVTQISARTRIGIEHVSFHHVVEGFSALQPNERKTSHIRSPSKKECVMSISVYFSDGSCCEEKVMVEIAPSSPNQILSKCKLSLLDGSGKVIECGEADNRFDATRKDIHKLPLSLTRQVILSRKSEYLPDDKLSLSCECVFSTGVEYQKIEKTLYDKPFVALNQISNTDQDNDICAGTLSECPSALDELKEAYSNQFLTDVELKTKTKSFPAHKILLCARSPVFKAMMTNDMKEKNSNIIQVDDLEDDVVKQLLLFLYSDRLENLQWESAFKLYYAGDKYAVEKLKKICSAFLVENVTILSVCEVLLLADKHNDCGLKKAVEDFIFKHEKQVYCSDEWENLIETNPSLVSKTMLLVYKRKI
ncbi:Speckle-type POZ protein [Araneus ventricosus]|uniref:Speckle-type POZ protein n=1 Tax=Araneus ventricosus TaxID=182803 RepID=A0A4Y2UVU7_ARAVE|nr:Speckle-type POZ protein [Araneus ventricosus]